MKFILKHLFVILAYVAFGLLVLFMMVPATIRSTITNSGKVEITAGSIMESESISHSAAILASDIADMVTLRDEIANSIPAASITRPATGDLLGEIVIDSVGIRNNLYFGDNNTILTMGAGMYGGSTLPGFGGLKLIAAHNQRGQFGELEKVAVGDIVTVSMPYGTYGYQVRESKVVSATDKTAYDFSVTDDKLIVYTCYPMYYSSSTDKRLFLYCDRVSGPSVR